MKNVRMFIVGLVSGVMLATAVSAFAASETVQATFEKFVLIVNGSEPQEIEPLTYKGTTYLPVRETANRLGYDVTYKADGKTIILNQTRKDVGSVNTITEPQTIDVNLDEWVSLRDLQISNNVVVTYDIPDGEDPTSSKRLMSIEYGGKKETFIIPSVIVGDKLFTNENGVQLLLKDGSKYVRKTFADQLLSQ